MKKRLLFFVGIVLFLSSALFANDNFDSILKEGKVWRYQYKLVVNPDYGEIFRFNDMCLGGDTLIEDIPFKRVMETKTSDEESVPDTEWIPQNLWIGEKDGKVYSYEGLTKSCMLLIDFTVEKGETIECLGSQWRVTAATDTILDSSVDKKVRHCLHIVNVEDSSREHVFVEGIGSLSTGLINTNDLDGGIPTLIQCSDEVVLYYYATSPSKIKSSIQPFNLGSQSFYDLHGRIMKELPQKGFYIKENNKKLFMNK